VLILSGDQLYRMDYRKIIDQHLATGADVTIAAIPFPVLQGRRPGPDAGA
jgi:glucose-1-phosphate adenylyltransferase